MASFGAKYPYFCPVEEEPEGALPFYKGEPVRIGRLVKADLTVNLASGKLFAENVDEFTRGSIAMETDDLEDENAAVLYGATVTDGAVRYNVGDDPPAGSLAYFKKLMRRKKVLYKGYFYPLVKAAPGDDTAQTKTDSITFGTSNTTLVQAIEWIKAQFLQAAAENPPGRERYLAFTVEAMFAINEIFGGSSELIEAIRDSGRAGFSAACKAAEILSQQGELVRRGLGYDPQPMTDAETIVATMAPSETTALKLAVPSALSLGYGREIEPENGEIDLGLAELDAQKKAVTRSHYIRMGTLAGLSKNETLLSTPGKIGDLWELYLQVHGVKRREPEDE